MKRLLGAVFLALAACGPGGGASTPSPTAVSTPSAPLFAVATGIPGPHLVNTNLASGKATVKIVDANGRVHAEASFVPQPAPNIGNAVPLLQSPVRVAGGAVFYADNTGAVRRLRPDGSNSVVATFPLTNAQQELSYAVSPDGAHLIAIVLSTPPLHSPPPKSLGDPIYQEGGHWTLKLETADAGGATTTDFERDFGTAYPTPTQIVGWDKNGPLATLTTQLGTQQALPSTHIFGRLIHLAPDGTHLDQLGGADCTAVDNLPDGTVLCDTDWEHFSVRSTNGAPLWSASLPSGDYYFGLWLSPDGGAVASLDVVIARTSVASAARQANGGGPQLIAMGWLDANTVVEADRNSGRLSLYAARGLVKMHDLGVSGIFEGLL